MDNICPICYCENDSVENQHITNCKHKFHKDCIKSWYTSGHSSCKTCPICRTILDLTLIKTFNSNLVTTYDEFIKLDGVIVYGSYILIKMKSSNWKSLLKNLLMLVSISSNMTFGTMVKTKICISNGVRDMTVGFILEDVKFIRMTNNQYIQDISQKLVISEMDELQFEGLKYFDKILLEITNNVSAGYSLIKPKQTYFEEDDEIQEEITNINSKVVVKMLPITRTYDVATKMKCDFSEYVMGTCCVAITPKVVTSRDRIFYVAECIDFALISGIKQNEEIKSSFDFLN